MAVDYPGLVYNSPSDGYGFSEAILPASDAAEPLVWQPLIPVGDFEHADFGPFSVTYDDLAAMESNFRSGLPVSKGIPIDENGLHDLRGDGAYGWVTDVQVREGWLWGGIQWTPAGLDAVGSGQLPYVSAHFWPSGSTAPEPYARDNFILSVALCTRPFFRDQPELRVAASSYRRLEPGTGGVRAANPEIPTPEVTTTVPEDTELQRKYEEAVAATATANSELETLKTTIASLTEERDGLKTTVASLTEECDGYKTQLGSLESRMAELENAGKLAEAKQRIAATALAKCERLAPAAIEIMANAEVFPTVENVTTLRTHLLANGGALLTVPSGEKDKGLTATAPTEEMSDEQWLAAKPITEGAKAEVRRIMAHDGVKASAAYGKYLKSMAK